MAARRSAPPKPSVARAHSAPPVDEALATLGLTPLEADVYRFLLVAPNSTGYRVAQAIGKPVGNIYKAIEGLEAKGAAITSDDDGNRVAAAVPVQEWLRSRRTAFERACDAAGTALPDAECAASEDLLFRLADRDQAIERARAMLDAAQHFAIASVAPAMMSDLEDALRSAARRVPVAVKCFVPVEIAGVETVLDPRGEKALELAPGAWIVLNVDGRESIFALFSLDGQSLHSASWSRHALLGWVHFSGLSSDLILADVRRRLAAGDSVETIRRAIDRWKRFESDTSAGKRSLVRRYRSAAPRGGAPR